MTPRERSTGALRGVTGTARGRLLSELCGTPRTAAELADRVRTSTSAVRIHLQALRRAGLVRFTVERRGVGKPRHVYSLTPAAEYLLSSAYLPALRAIVDTLRRRLDGEAAEWLREAGTTLPGESAAPRGKAPDVSSAVRLLRELGGSPRLEAEGDAVVLHSACCPLGGVTRGVAEMCKFLEGAVATVTGAVTRERCDRGDQPHCAFVIAAAAGLRKRRAAAD